MGLKNVSRYIGYEEAGLEIHGGLEALMKYHRYLKEKKPRKPRIRKDLLAYNKSDLEATKFVFDYLQNLFNRNSP